MVTTPAKVSKVEGIKERSHALREPVATELLQDTTHFSEEGVQILKYHGSYQQDNRDNRTKGQEKDYSFMLRTRNPGGEVPAQLYLALDTLADQYANHTLRATTRQGFQLHGILKKDLKTVLATIVHNLGSTLGACGDVNRNVMAPAAPFKNRPEYVNASEYADRLAGLLAPQTGAYYEIWLDGEKAISAEPHPDVIAALHRNGNGTIIYEGEEPIYGEHYMPRKFKACVTVPGDNSVDLFSQDLSLVLISSAEGEVEGFNLYAGGGLARTHNKEETFPRLADPIGYVDKADIYDAVKAVVATQRDYGDRFNRRHARLKYLLSDWGVEKFREKLESYLGKPMQPLRPTVEFQYKDYLGWQEQGDGKLFLGINIQNGRVKDDGTMLLKTALRQIQEKFQLPMRLMPSQSLLLYNIDPTAQAEIQEILDRHNVQRAEAIDPLIKLSMACPALPTCGLAITESERAIPEILDRIRALLNKVGLPQASFITRMTGCPNGCARPYLAELGFVGQSPESYQIWLGASPDQTRLSQAYIDNMAIADLEITLEPVFVCFKKNRKKGESFGDFCDRFGFAALREFAATYESPVTKSGKPRYRVGIRDGVYDRLKAAATEQGKPMTDVVNEAVDFYLQSLKS